MSKQSAYASAVIREALTIYYENFGKREPVNADILALIVELLQG